MKKRYKLLCLLVMLSVVLTGCRGYTDASVKIPTGWTGYTIGPLQFQFEAGWSTSDTDTLTEGLSGGAGICSETATAKVIGALESPVREQGTKDYLVVTCYTMEEKTQTSDLEEVMDDLNGMARTIKNQAGLNADVEQNARIRHYGSTDALTIAYKRSGEEVSAMIQLALIAKGDHVFQIAYCDFTTIKDDSTLEAILSSLTISLED